MPRTLTVALFNALLLNTIPAAFSASRDQISSKTIPPLTISIVVPDGISTDGTAIELRDDTACFDVVIQNVSDKPLPLWDYNCSWGFDNVSFEVEAIDGILLTKPIAVTRGVVSFGANAPIPRMLPPHGIIIQEIHLYLKNATFKVAPNLELPVLPWGDIYMHFPLPKKGSRETVSLRAFFEIPADDWAKQGGIWTGKVASEVKDFTVFWKP